jgi:DNA-directed RNA polymerase specialized sigma24 family protein
MRVTATATRTGQWWAIEVLDVAGGLHTQARRLDQVASAVIDAVALVADVSPDTVQVDVIPKLPPAETELIESARSASQEAAHAAERASKLSRQAVERLRSEGLTVRDVGRLLGVSPQRVSQLLNAQPHALPATGALHGRPGDAFPMSTG